MSVLARPFTMLVGAFDCAICGTRAASAWSSPSTINSEFRALTVATASRIRSSDECEALPFVEKERNATRGSACKKVRALRAASIAMSASWVTEGTGTTAQSAKTRSADGIDIRKKLETVLDAGLRPMQ